MPSEKEEKSTVKIGIVSILALASVILGFFFVAVMNHESRLSKTEANQEYMVKSFDEIKVTLKDMNKSIGEIKR